ncbi:MAG: hypothetical protein L0Y66_03670 [Myxococcaceae bacterium]|nr:hypothetical protein [Myxococcaceae bacterium]
MDAYIFVAGERLSETLRRMYLAGAAEVDQSLLNRLLGKEQAFLRSVPKMLEMQRLLREQKFKEALAVYAELPAMARQEKANMLLRLAAAVQVGEAEYSQAIGDFEKQFPNDPALDLVSMDGHFLRKDYAATLRSIARLDRRVQDPYLQFIRGSVQLEKGDRKEAKARFQAAIDQEPTLQVAYFTLLGLSLQDREHKETARLLTALERDAEITLNDLEGVEEYAEFVKSREYKAWKKQRAAASSGSP